MINYIYFYKNNSKYGFLSQFYKCKFIENDIIFNSAEQYMMYNKAKLFNNIILANKILKETNPSIVKKYGRQVINFNEEIWVKHREEIVYNGNILKFTQNLELLELLKKTEGNILDEAAPYDNIWGIGITIKEGKSGISWNGLNLLGNILMKVRDNI